jgi:hypothetical protein
MELDKWFDFYSKIISDFNFSKDEDERSAVILYSLAREKLMDTLILDKKIRSKDVLIIGPVIGEEEIEKIKNFEGVKITAGKAIKIVRSLIPEFVPDIHVTDMEEEDYILVDLQRKNCILVLHAHGDNVERIYSIVPKLRFFIGTTQSIPFDKIYNFGGFTDGDRAAILAKEFGASSITLIGFDFERADEIKRKKLKWAKEILTFEGLI